MEELATESQDEDEWTAEWAEWADQPPELENNSGDFSVNL